MSKRSAGILLYRKSAAGIEVFLVHPGGPFWTRKDTGSWSIPKGEYGEDEDPFEVAMREFSEETSFEIDGDVVCLLPVRQAGGKVVQAWAVEGDCDAEAIKSNTFTIEWPPKSGREQTFPEVDRAAWFRIREAREKILKGQAPLLNQLQALLE